MPLPSIPEEVKPSPPVVHEVAGLQLAMNLIELVVPQQQPPPVPRKMRLIARYPNLFNGQKPDAARKLQF